MILWPWASPTFNVACLQLNDMLPLAHRVLLQHRRQRALNSEHSTLLFRYACFLRHLRPLLRFGFCERSVFLWRRAADLVAFSQEHVAPFRRFECVRDDFLYAGNDRLWCRGRCEQSVPVVARIALEALFRD